MPSWQLSRAASDRSRGAHPRSGPSIASAASRSVSQSERSVCSSVLRVVGPRWTDTQPLFFEEKPKRSDRPGHGRRSVGSPRSCSWLVLRFPFSTRCPALDHRGTGGLTESDLSVPRRGPRRADRESGDRAIRDELGPHSSVLVEHGQRHPARRQRHYVAHVEQLSAGQVNEHARQPLFGRRTAIAHEWAKLTHEERWPETRRARQSGEYGSKLGAVDGLISAGVAVFRRQRSHAHCGFALGHAHRSAGGVPARRPPGRRRSRRISCMPGTSVSLQDWRNPAPFSAFRPDPRGAARHEPPLPPPPRDRRRARGRRSHSQWTRRRR